MVNFERSKAIFPASARDAIIRNQARLQEDKAVGQDKAGDRSKLKALETFIASPEWQAERNLRRHFLFKLEDQMLRGDLVPLAVMQAIRQEEVDKQPSPHEVKLVTEERLEPPPVNRLQSIQGLVWETTTGIRFRFDESGQYTTLDAQGAEQVLALEHDTPVRPVYPVDAEEPEYLVDFERLEAEKQTKRISIAEQRQWAQLLDDYKLIQPFPQLHRLDTSATAESCTQGTTDLFNRWLNGMHTEDAHYQTVQLLETALYNLPIPGQTVAVQGESEPEVYRWFVTTAQQTQLYEGISSYDVQAVLNQQQTIRRSFDTGTHLRQLAHYAMVLRRFEDCADDELPDLHLLLSRDLYLGLSVSTLHDYEQRKLRIGKSQEFYKLLSDQLWVTDQGNYCYCLDGRWYNTQGTELVLSDQDVISVVNPEDLKRADYQALKMMLGPDHPFSQYWFDDQYVEGYVVESGEFKRRCTILKRFIERVPQETRQQLANGSRDTATIPTPQQDYISPRLIKEEYCVERKLFSEDQNSAEETIKAIAWDTISNVIWNRKLRCIAWLGKFDPHSITGS